MGRKAVHLTPQGYGRQAAEFNMNSNKHLAFALLTIFSFGSFLSPVAFSQDSLTSSFSISVNAPSVSSPQDKLHALESTRFHFITLKQFHSSLFTNDKASDHKISDMDARLLNGALNTFLTRAGRETLLLEALRQNRSVRLKFNIPQKTEEYKIIDNPDKPLAYRLEPVVRSVPATIEIKPLLDKPVAFEITVKKGKERYLYDINWSGKIICITCLNSSLA